MEVFAGYGAHCRPPHGPNHRRGQAAARRRQHALHLHRRRQRRQRRGRHRGVASTRTCSSTASPRSGRTTSRRSTNSADRSTSTTSRRAWAHAMDTPFQWTKQVASHFGGTRNPMIVSWPARIKDKGGLRSQFHHVIDVVPTLYEACGITAPTDAQRGQAEADRGHQLRLHVRRRQRQGPADDAVLRAGCATGASTTTAGWRRHGRSSPWEPIREEFDPDKAEVGALQHRRGLLAGERPGERQHPEKLRELQDLWWVEAAKYNVLPLDWRGSRAAERRSSWAVPASAATARRSPTTPVSSGCPMTPRPAILNKSWTITADIEVPEDGAKGMIVDARRTGRRLRPVPARGQADVRLQLPRPRPVHVRGARSRCPRAR